MFPSCWPVVPTGLVQSFSSHWDATVYPGLSFPEYWGLFLGFFYCEPRIWHTDPQSKSSPGCVNTVTRTQPLLLTWCLNFHTAEKDCECWGQRLRLAEVESFLVSVFQKLLHWRGWVTPPEAPLPVPPFPPLPPSFLSTHTGLCFHMSLNIYLFCPMKRFFFFFWRCVDL